MAPAAIVGGSDASVRPSKAVNCGFDDRHFGVQTFVNRKGYTTIGAACAILLTFALILGGTWASRSLSRSQGVQEVANAAALAAENEVAEFVIAVRVADAVLLSMSLTGLGLLGVGAVCCCVPQTASLGERLITAGTKVIDARDDFAQTQVDILSATAAALPVTAQAQAQLVAQENADLLQGEALALAELSPTTGEVRLSGDLDQSSQAASEVANSADEIEEQARIAQEQCEQANEAYQEAFESDCGNYPKACAAERAESLAGLSAAKNPTPTSVSAWSFLMALQRAQDYYAARKDQEAAAQPESFEEQCNSTLRYHYYCYACDTLEEGYVRNEHGDVPEIYLPTLPRNTAEMKETSLYTQQVYPVSGGALHVCAACPAIQGAVDSYGSVAQLDAGEFESCAACGLSASMLGNVASASTSIDNGFEYHYRRVSECAEAYCAAKAAAAPALSQAKGLLEQCFEALGEALKQACNCRIEAFAPGRYGAVVALGFDAESEQGVSVAEVFSTSGDLGNFAAISAATLVEDEDDNVISGLLDPGLMADSAFGSTALALPDAALNLWSGILGAYGKGVEGLTSAVSGLLGGLPLSCASGLGSWASEQFTRVLSECGLQPASMASAKPVVVNTSHVISFGDGPLCATLQAAKLEEGSAAGDAAGANGTADLGFGGNPEAIVQLSIEGGGQNEAPG